EEDKESLFDIVIFGSILKGKEFSDDADICVIFRKKKESIIPEIERIDGAHVNYLMLDEVYEQRLWRTLIKEGFSIAKEKKLQEIFGQKNYGLFTYDIRELKKKSRFSQIMSGYKSESILKRTEGKVLKPGIALIPIENVELFRSFLEVWKAKYTLKYITMEE
ncbi:MAG: hypothetical protein NT001_05425, partial [Candidatus Woesearchaeota archaeon]|nr:hypothetical protein [Candidatus Woesearchaeota archaeon]